MNITPRIALEVASHEALVRRAYKDSVGVWTWSVGLTSATGHRVDRYINNPASLQRCLDVYVWALENYADHVREVFNDYALNEAQFAAALSFTWNLGGGALRRAKWVKHFKAGRMAEAEAAFKSWRKAGGKISQGLVNRRAEECDLLFRGKWSNDGTITEYTKLTSMSTVDWGSAKKTKVTAELTKAFDGTSVELDHTPKPNASQRPTTSPIKPPKGTWEMRDLFIILVFVAIGLLAAIYWGFI